MIDLSDPSKRTDADVGADRTERLLQRRNDVLEDGFVGDEVVGSEEAVGFGELGDKRPERVVVKTIGKGFRRRSRRRREAQQQRQNGEGEDRELGMPRAGHVILGRIIT